MSLSMNSQIPVLRAQGNSLAEMWENSVVELWHCGCRIRTEYDDKDDAGNFVHPSSIDATMLMTCWDPASEPALHRAFPGGLEDLEEYRLEVIEGIKDHWTADPDDPEDHRWRYTYHQRLRRYKCYKRTNRSRKPIDGTSVRYVQRELVHVDQLAYMIEKLAKSPHSRRANAVTWMPWEDPDDEEPPCLQSIWCRILEDDQGIWWLNMNVRFRSRDAFDAAFMNVWAFAGPQGLQGWIADEISKRAGRPVACGRYCDLSDSYHIYGKRSKVFEESVIADLERRSFEDRTWPRSFALGYWNEARPKILQKIRTQDGVDEQA